MPELVVDFSDVKTFEPLPIDWYNVEVSDARIGKSQAGNAKVTLILKVTDGEHEGRNLICDLVLEGDGRWKTKQAFEALLGEAEGQVSISTETLVGTACTVRVTQRVWREEDGGDGTVRNNISTFRPLQFAQSELEGLFAEGAKAAPATEQLVEKVTAEGGVEGLAKAAAKTPAAPKKGLFR